MHLTLGQNLPDISLILGLFVLTVELKLCLDMERISVSRTRAIDAVEVLMRHVG